jgi:hypothetical protein
MFSVAYNYESMLLAYADSPGITVSTVYWRKFLEHHLCPALQCKWPHCLWSGSAEFHDNAQSHGLYWLVQKMELGSSGTSTVLTRYMPMWLWLLLGGERAIALHLLQDDRWWWGVWKEHVITDIARRDTADGGRCLLQVWQHFCIVRGHYIYSL